MPELSEELRRELQLAGDAPLRLVDPETRREYVLVPAEQYEVPRSDNESSNIDWTIPEGIRQSMAAIRRALPKLLASWWTRGKWVCYHRDVRIGVGRDYFALQKECIKLGLADDEYVIARIAPAAGSEEIEEVDRTFVEFDEEND